MIHNVLDNYDYQPDPRWNNKILNYDTDRHNWSDWFLEIVQQLKPKLKNLEDVHLHFSTSELIGLRKHLEKFTKSQEFSRRLDNFFEEYVSPLVDYQEYLIQSTCGIRVVVPDQENLGRLLSFHTGYWTGYSNKMGTVWTPLTRTFDNNSMQVLSWEDSKSLMSQIHTNKLPLEDIQSLCIEKCYPVNIKVGQSWLFNQGHLHGNVNNNTGITRMSFDARWATGDFGPRRPGSFFRYKGHHAEINKAKIQSGSWIIFIDQNSQYIGKTAHYMIREYLLSFAKDLGIAPTEWSNEYWSCIWMPKLRDFVNRNTLSGIVMPSIHAFSGDVDLRLELFETAIKNGQQLIFADENILVTTLEDLEVIKKLCQLQVQ